jgi:hypothetical protein
MDETTVGNCRRTDRRHSVKTKLLLLVTAVTWLGNGVVTLVSPTTQLSLYDVEGHAATLHMAQWAGLGSVVVGLLAWFGFRAASPAATRPYIWTLLVYYIVAAALSASGVLAGTVGRIGVVLAVVTGLFAVGYGAALLGRANARGPGVGPTVANPRRAGPSEV